MGGMLLLFKEDGGSDGGAGFGLEACLAVSDDPVSICTTCLKEVESAWTKVVGYGLDSDLEMGFGVCGGVPLPWLMLLPLLFGEFEGDGFSISRGLDVHSIDGQREEKEEVGGGEVMDE